MQQAYPFVINTSGSVQKVSVDLGEMPGQGLWRMSGIWSPATLFDVNGCLSGWFNRELGTVEALRGSKDWAGDSTDYKPTFEFMLPGNSHSPWYDCPYDLNFVTLGHVNLTGRGLLLFEWFPDPSKQALPVRVVNPRD